MTGLGNIPTTLPPTFAQVKIIERNDTKNAVVPCLKIRIKVCQIIFETFISMILF